MANLELRMDTQFGEVKVSVPFVRGEQAVTLTDHGMKKIGTIKVVRMYTGLPLKEAKDLVEDLPKTFTSSDNSGVKSGIEPFHAELLGIGAIAEITDTASTSPEGILISKIVEAFLG
jgi:ribosomal protein L7/L12